MADITARFLLRRAEELFDSQNNGLAKAARPAWRGGFSPGGEWMRAVMAELRGAVPCGSGSGLDRLGMIKYGTAAGAAAACACAAHILGAAAAIILGIAVFYAVESQFVFVFPLALDGCEEPFWESSVWARRAGGTLAVMRVVLPLAASMLAGGFFGRGFVRSWSLGCLAVCVWYEELRR